MRGLVRVLAAALMLAATAIAWAEPIPVADFWKRSSFREVKISPDGRYLAATVPLEQQTALVVMDLTSKSVTASFKPQEKAHIGAFYWVSNRRLLFTSAVREGANARPSWTGLWYAINADGSNVGTAYGKGYYAQLLDTLKDDDKYVLVQYASDSGSSTYGRMNVENGDILPSFKRPPKEGYGEFVTDNAAAIRLFINAKSYKESKVYARANATADWLVIHDQKASGQDFEFKGFSADNNTLYYTLSQESGPNALFAYDFKTSEKKQIARDDNVDPGALMASPVDGSVYAIRFEDGFPRYEFLDKDNPFARNLRKVQAAFPDADVYPVSATRDGSKIIYVVESDTIAGEYYLFDERTQKAEHLVSRAAWLDSARLAQMDPMKFKARDGLEIEVFVTMPRSAVKGQRVPLIVNPHGGPFGPYDTWGYNPEVQMLASRGYAVMQVNFRGSGNYGKAFQEKGYRQWGKQMQDDLTDATRWAIAQGIADASRICIYGASYGGYAALMAVAKEPALYRCAVGNVGPYDLPRQLNYSTNGGGSMNPLKTFFGDVAQDDVAQFSPARLAGNIKVPVLLFAGAKDTTCPPEQSQIMYSALKQAGVPVELKIYPGEGHGNVLKENQIDFANRLLDFFEKNLKPAAEVGHTRTSLP